MRRLHRPLLVATLLPLALASCVSLKPLRTSSGSPEIVVQSSRPAELIAGLGSAMQRHGYRRVLENERLAVFSKDCGDFDTAFFYGEGWNASADFLVSFYLSQDPLGLRVQTDLEIVTQPGTPDEARRTAPQGHPEAHAIQDMLELLSADLALRRHEELWPDEPVRPSAPAVWTGGGSR